MKKQLVLMFIVALLVTFCIGDAFGAQRYVNPSNFRDVIEKIADPWDTIIFRDGVYNVNKDLEVDKPLTLKAQHHGGATLVATDNFLDVIRVTSPHVTISDLIINGNGNTWYMG